MTGGYMNLTQILDFLKGLGPVLEPILLNAEQNNLQPELKKLIDQVQSPDLKALLVALDGALDAFLQSEIKKLGS